MTATLARRRDRRRDVREQRRHARLSSVLAALAVASTPSTPTDLAAALTGCVTEQDAPRVTELMHLAIARQWLTHLVKTERGNFQLSALLGSARRRVGLLPAEDSAEAHRNRLMDQERSSRSLSRRQGRVDRIARRLP